MSEIQSQSDTTRARTRSGEEYAGSHPDVSNAVRKLYDEKVPKCPLCQETYLYTKKSQERGICSKCRGADERKLKREEAERKRAEEAQRKADAAAAAAKQAQDEADATALVAQAETAEAGEQTQPEPDQE